ncbi:MAG: Spy/CpxP family protein refolding chaperone [Desulfobulbaceae bacterium]|nr:Spy/CpxP family protein refolding chaperone [Desulfobulbaceae bacterium]
MKQRAFPAKLAVVMVTFLSIIFLANVQGSFAASGTKKTPAGARISAVDRTEDSIKQLHTALKITETQKESWNNLTQAMRENAIEMDAFSKERVETIKDMNALERMKFHCQMTEANLNQQRKLIPTFEVFYTSLSDAQKTITDALFRTGKHGKHKFN